MMKDNFIEDDDGGGYVDDGNDDWQRAKGSGDEDEEDDLDADELMDAFGTKRRTTKKGKQTLKRSFAEQSDYVKSNATAGAKGRSSALKAPTGSGSLFATRDASGGVARSLFGGSGNKAQKQDDDFLSNIMDDLEQEKPSTTARHSKAASRRQTDSVVAEEDRQNHVNDSLRARAQRDDLREAPADSTFARFRTTRALDMASSSSPRTEAGHPSSESIQSPEDVHAGGLQQQRVRIKGGTSPSPPWDHEDPASSPLPTKKLKMANLTSRTTVPEVRVDANNSENASDDEADETHLAINNAHAADSRARATVEAAAPTVAKAKVAGKTAAEMIDWRELHATLLQGEKDDDDDDEMAELSKKSTKKASIRPRDDSSDAEATGAPSATANLAATADSYLEANKRDLHFYWFDYLESGDKLWLIGKVKDKHTGKYISCCVTVEGLERCLYVLPRRAPEEQSE